MDINIMKPFLLFHVLVTFITVLLMTAKATDEPLNTTRVWNISSNSSILLYTSSENDSFSTTPYSLTEGKTILSTNEKMTQDFQSANETTTRGILSNKTEDHKFYFYAENINESRPELHVGMKGVVRLRLICPPGLYDQVHLGLEGNTLTNIDIHITVCKTGSSIRSQEFQMPFGAYYSESLDTRLSSQNKGNFQNSGFALFLRVLRVGDNFYPGPQLEHLMACTLLPNFGTEEVILTFPTHWVNRGYYDTENTTNNDVIEFEAGVVLSESANIGANYSATISILINDTQVWNTTVILIANSSLNNKTATVKLREVSPKELHVLPGSKTSLMLEVTSDNLRLQVSTRESTGTGQAALEIENIIVDRERTALFTEDCTPVNFSFSFSKTKNSSIHNLVDGTLSFINPTGEGSSNSITLIVYLRVDSRTAKFGDTHIISAVIENSFSTYNITISKPDLLQDKNGDVLSKMNTIFDGNDTTCLRIPDKGDIPPLFWMKINTEWLNISSEEYNVIILVAGEQISCNLYERRILKVYFPKTISKNGSHEEVEFCNLASNEINESQGECVFSCKCRNTNECSKLVLFMANHDNTFPWKLCELKARNI